MNRRVPQARWRQAANAAALCLGLAACVSQPPRPALPELTPAQLNAAQRAQQMRESKLGEFGSWSLSGRVALAKGRHGGSGRIEWVQKDLRNYEVTLNAPVSRQSWRLSGNRDDQGGRLEGLEGGPREGGNAQILLLEVTGWDIPVHQLPAWLRGVISRERSRDGAPARVVYGADGRLAAIEQFGWTVEYQEWTAAQGDRPELPRRLIARSGDATVRLIVDQWTMASP